MSSHGYIPYKPTAVTQNILLAAKNTLVEYEAWNSPLTVRQVFYRLVAEYGYDKTEGAYGSLVNYIARARRAYQHAWIDAIHDGKSADEATQEVLATSGLIPFSWIRDEKGQAVTPPTYDDGDEFLGSVREAAENMHLDRQDGQPRYIELWCEAAGMVPLLADIGEPFSIRVSSGGGYDSVTAKHQLCQRIIRRYSRENLHTTVLHIGDFDPSGEGMFETLTEDVSAMCWDLSGREPVQFKRIALREDQVIEMDVETAPPKPKDARSRGFIDNHPEAVEHYGSEDITAQLEALTPPDLRRLIEEAINSNLNQEVYDRVLEREEETREEILERLE